jgi:hypothetical protein
MAFFFSALVEALVVESSAESAIAAGAARKMSKLITVAIHSICFWCFCMLNASVQTIFTLTAFAGSFGIYIGCKKLNLTSFTPFMGFGQSICIHAACVLQQSVIILYSMKQYVIDELRAADYQALKTYLNEQYGSAALDEIQLAHTECRPQCFAVDLDDNRLACEFLVRSKSRVRCDCMDYATENQRNWLIGLIDSIFDRLQIKT